jgi:PAS domain S-box-containing protein
MGIFQADASGRCRYANRRLEMLTGYSAEELSGEGWRRTVHPDDLETSLREGLASAQAGSDFEQTLRVVTRKGEVLRVLVRVAAKRSDNGRITEFVGTVESIAGQERSDPAEANGSAAGPPLSLASSRRLTP